MSWYRRRHLEQQVAHHTQHGWHNVGFASFCTVVEYMTDVTPWMVLAGVFWVAGISHLQDARKAARELKGLP